MSLIALEWLFWAVAAADLSRGISESQRTVFGAAAY
jgi:hypothetical protein